MYDASTEATENDQVNAKKLVKYFLDKELSEEKRPTLINSK